MTKIILTESQLYRVFGANVNNILQEGNYINKNGDLCYEFYDNEVCPDIDVDAYKMRFREMQKLIIKGKPTREELLSCYNELLEIREAIGDFRQGKFRNKEYCRKVGGFKQAIQSLIGSIKFRLKKLDLANN